MNLENIIKKASKKLKDNNIPSYILDAEVILADIMKIKRENLILNGGVILDLQKKHILQNNLINP